MASLEIQGRLQLLLQQSLLLLLLFLQDAQHLGGIVPALVMCEIDLCLEIE